MCSMVTTEGRLLVAWLRICATVLLALLVVVVLVLRSTWARITILAIRRRMVGNGAAEGGVSEQAPKAVHIRTYPW